MQTFRTTDTAMSPADPATFTGPVQTKLFASSEAGTPVHVYRVAFEDGGRTNWHTHSNVQWLFVVEGRIRVQSWGHAPVELGAGDAVAFPPGEKHWHGAVPGDHGVHVAVNVDVKTTWLEPVTDAQYQG